MAAARSTSGQAKAREAGTPRQKAAAPRRQPAKRPAKRSPTRAPANSHPANSAPANSAPANSAPANPANGKTSGVGTSGVTSITPFLWFDSNLREAAEFYVALFPGSYIESIGGMGGSFVLAGQRFMGLNGGPMYKFSPAVSFFVVCRDQAEVDRLWKALGKGGKPSRCGWIDDRFGLTWQIVPQAFLDLTGDPDPKKVQAVFGAMMGMVKMDVKGLQAAYDAA